MVDYLCAGCEKPINLPGAVKIVGQDLYFHAPVLVADKGTQIGIQTGAVPTCALTACYFAYGVKQLKDGKGIPVLSFEPIKQLDDIANQ